MEHIGVIEEAGFKPKKPPKVGNNFCMKVSGWDKTYYINQEADKPLQVLAVSLMGKTVKVTYEQNGEYRNVSAMEEVAPALNTPVSPNAETMTKADWDKKDWRIHRSAIAKAIIEVGGTCEDADRWVAWVYEPPQDPATKPFANPPMLMADKPAVAVQGTPISQLPVEQVLSEIWPHLWKTHKITKSKVAELKGWMTNALKDSGFTIPESMEKAKPEQVYAMGEYARREAQSATK